MQVMYRRRACTQVLFIRKAELGFFQAGSYVPLVRRSQYNLAGTFHCTRSPLLKTGFFRQVRELKTQRKIQALLYVVCKAHG
jgi:hypothetical protein